MRKPSPPSEISPTTFWGLLAFTFAGVSLAFGLIKDHWMGMTVVMGLALVGALTLPAIRQQLKPSVSSIAIGAVAGLIQFAITVLSAALLFRLRPDWAGTAKALYSLTAGHSPVVLAATLPMIILSEELIWRGVVARFLTERWGLLVGVMIAASTYALAHWAAFNPLLVAAAAACGLFWGLIYATTKNLVAPTIAHLVWDVLLLFVWPVV
jgi:membrane protease YdiL (CAAX protease family)